MKWNTTTQVTTEAVTNDEATGWPALARRDEALVSVEIGIQIVIFLLAVGGNGLVLGMLVAMSRRKDLGRMYTMIGHLSCADLFVAICNLLPQVQYIQVYLFACSCSKQDFSLQGRINSNAINMQCTMQTETTHRRFTSASSECFYVDAGHTVHTTHHAG